MMDEEERKHERINPAAAVATGIVIGASAAVVGAAIMKNEKSRNAIKKLSKDVKNHMTEHMEDFGRKAKKKAEESKAKIDEANNEVKKKTVASIDSVQDKLEEVKENL